ncbi:MAG: hypothetical protein WD009_13670 [Phycisphaeraceae bacterium]
MLIALAITALLLTATVVAVDVSFRAYAIAAESASTQTATRMVTHRLLTMIRTSVAHEPLTPGGGVILYDPDPDDEDAVLDQNTMVSNYIELLDTNNNHIRIEYNADEHRLYVTTTPYPWTATGQTRPLLGGVHLPEGVDHGPFYLHRRIDRNGTFVLQRATMDIVVEPDEDNTLPVEAGNTQPVRMIASTMPRRLD